MSVVLRRLAKANSKSNSNAFVFAFLLGSVDAPIEKTGFARSGTGAYMRVEAGKPNNLQANPRIPWFAGN